MSLWLFVPKNFRLLCVLGMISFCVVFCADLVFASSNKPNLQEMRAAHELELVKMQKQQQAAILIKQRDELLASYKTFLRTKNDAYNQMKVAERDYKIALAKFNKSQEQHADLQAQIIRLKENSGQVDKKTLQEQLGKLQDAQTKVINDLNNFSRIQQDSYASMQSFDSQYRNFMAKDQILKNQIDAVQRQLQFVLSQP